MSDYLNGKKPEISSAEHTLPHVRIFHEQAKWTRFLGVVVFVAAGFLGIAGIFTITSSPLLLLLYLPAAGIAVVMGILLNGISDRMNRYSNNRTIDNLRRTAAVMRSYFKFQSILFLAAVGIGIIAVILIILLGVSETSFSVFEEWNW